MRRPVMYIFINKELNMTTGKAVAQGIHAAIVSTAKAPSGLRDYWLSAVHRTVLVMEARDQEHIHNIQEYLEERGILCHKIIDEGVNEIDPHVATALATTMLDRESEADMEALSTFELYRDKIKVIMEISR